MQSEWRSENPRAVLDIPTDLLAAQRFKFSARDLGLTGTCADVEHEMHGVRLVNVLVDTSQRVSGTPLDRRVTHRAFLLAAWTPLLVFPLSEDERKESR